MKSIAIFGSTGSVGQQTVDLLKDNLDQYQIEVITANNNFELLAEQARQLKAKVAIIANENLYKQLQQELSSTKIKVAAGNQALLEYAAMPADISIMAIVGIAGLLPTIQTLQNAKIVGLANKESLVCAGHIINNMQNKAKIIPLDSEHNAIFQIYNPQVQKITLTASGGPLYRNNKKKDVASIINHPIWKMGKKISVDSATMVNKVLEVIEAHYLFNIAINNIEILIHPEAIMHGMITYADGNNIAALNNPSMKIPISYVLNWPKRGISPNQLDLIKLTTLSFDRPDPKQFPALNLLKSNNYTALNAANEVAVNAFLEEKIAFDRIVPTIEEALAEQPSYITNSIEEVIAYDQEIRSLAISFINK